MSNFPNKDFLKPSVPIDRFSLPSGSIAYTGSEPSRNSYMPSPGFQMPSFQPTNTSDKLNEYIGKIVEDAKLLKPHVTGLYTPQKSPTLSTGGQFSSLGSPETRTSTTTYSSTSNTIRCGIGAVSPSKIFTQPSFSLETMTTFLARVGAATHPEIDRLYRLSNMWSHAREIPERDETIFNALSCCFFEKVLPMESKDITNSQIKALFTQEEWVRSQMFLFVTLLKGLAQDPSDPNRIQKFYEAMGRSPNLYQKGIASFKEIIIKLIKQIENQQVSSLHLFFKWMNEFDYKTQELCKRLAQVLEVNIKVLTLTSMTFKEDVFPCLKDVKSVENNGNSKDFTIFFHKTNEQAFILCSNIGDIYSPPEKETITTETPTTERRFAFVPPENQQETDYLSKNQQLGPKPFQNVKENQLELRYGTLQPKKPRVAVEVETIKPKTNPKANPLYNAPVPVPGEMQKPINFGFNVEQPQGKDGSFDSNWLSNDSFSDLPSYPEGQDPNVIPKSLLDDSLGLNDEPAPEMKTPSMNKISFIRSQSEDKKALNLNNSRKNKEGGNEPNILDLLEDVWEKDSQLLSRVQTPNRIIHHDFELTGPYEPKRRNSFDQSGTFDGHGFSLEKKMSIPDQLTSRFVKLNQKLVSHNAEFNEATVEHIIQGNQQMFKLCHMWGYDGVINTYKKIVNKKNKEESPTSGALHAMAMDDNE